MAVIDVRESALNALLAWDAARRHANDLRAQRNAHRCTERCAADFTTGDPGQAECWRMGMTDDACDECKEREKFREPIEWALRKQSELRQKMQRQAARLAKVKGEDTTRHG
jgi:hypothetical protein